MKWIKRVVKKKCDTYVAYPYTILAVTFISPGCTRIWSLGFLWQKKKVTKLSTAANYLKRSKCLQLCKSLSPFAAHVQQEHIESSLLLLHLGQYILHTDAVFGCVGGRCINGDHETVAIVFITVSSKVQQSCVEKARNDLDFLLDLLCVKWKV